MKGSRARSFERGGAGGKPEGWVAAIPPGERAPGVWLASFKLLSAVHGEVGKSATSVGLRAPAGCFVSVKGGSINNTSGSPRSRHRRENPGGEVLFF